MKVRKKKWWMRIRFFRVVAVGLGAFALFMLAQFPAKLVSIENQTRERDSAAAAYSQEQARNNELNAEMATINSPDFIERTARREYDYCWYGEVIYEVGNLDEIVAEPEFDVYGE